MPDRKAKIVWRVNPPEADAPVPFSQPVRHRGLWFLRWQDGGCCAGFAAMKIPALLFTVMFAPMLSAAELFPPAEAANALGLDLYRLEGAKSPGNLILSPYSIQSALCMTLGGADGVTKEEMARVLHLDGKSDAAPGELAALRQALEKAAETSAKQAAQAKKYGGSFEPLQLRVANRLFGRTGYPFHPDFLKSTETLWRAPLEAIDFGKAEAARTHINGWVEQQTEKRIRDLIPKGGVN